MISPVWFPVPPTGYGGIEWVVWLLADGLVDAGHEVTLFASGDSHTKAKLSSVFPVAPSARIGQTLPELQHCLAAYARADEFDVINDHSGLPAAAIGGLIDKPGAAHDPRAARRRGRRDLRADRRGRAGDRVHLGLDEPAEAEAALPVGGELPERARLLALPGEAAPRRLPALPRPDEPGQGLPPRDRRRGHRRAAAEDRRARTASRSSSSTSRSSSRRTSPTEIEYLGEVTHGEKVELLQNARATLFPIEWEEPFGLVMIESMACGTPVIATRWGAVPEVIEHGRSGIIVDDYRLMAAAIEEADRLDPLELVRYAQQHFSPERMVADYVRAFRGRRS